MENKNSVTCQKATFWISLKEDNQLSVDENHELSKHLSVCLACRNFESQSAFISKMIKKGEVVFTLDDSVKKRISEKLNQAKNL